MMGLISRRSRRCAAQLIVSVVGLVGPAYVLARRRGWSRQSRALTPEESRRLAGYFSEALLQRVRIAEVDRISLWAPVGWVGDRLSRRLGLSGTPAGLALDDLVVLCTPSPERMNRMSTLFHEMVHVVQWRALGRGRFLRAYLGGWADAAGDYWSIPLEQMAYQMQLRFDAGERFDAEDQVRSVLAPLCRGRNFRRVRSTPESNP